MTPLSIHARYGLRYVRYYVQSYSTYVLLGSCLAGTTGHLGIFLGDSWCRADFGNLW